MGGSFSVNPFIPEAAVEKQQTTVFVSNQTFSELFYKTAEKLNRYVQQEPAEQFLLDWIWLVQLLHQLGWYHQYERNEVFAVSVDRC